MNNTTTSAQPEDPIKKVTIFIIVSMSLLMTTIDTTIVATALETIQKDLNTTVSWVGWTITAYSFGFALMLPLSAKLSNYFGARRLYLASIAIFTIASLACGLVSSIAMIIPIRIIQALGAAGITPSVTSIIVDHFGRSRDRAVSLFGSIFPIGVIIGPIFGGLFVTYLTWRWIFFVNVPIGLAVILLSLYYIPHDKPLNQIKRSKLDWPGLFWLGLGLLAAMFGATFLSHRGVKIYSPIFLGLVIASVAGFVAFFRHIKGVDQPFLRPRFVYGKAFGSVNLMNLFYAGVTSGCISLVPLYVSNRYGISPLNASMLLIAQGVASVIFSTIVTMLLRRTGYRLPMLVGCVVILIGMAGMAFPPQLSMSPMLWMIITTFFIGTGIGILNPPSRNAGLQLAPHESATLAALRSQGLQIGSIVVVGIATAIISEMPDPGIGQAWIYGIIAGLYLLGLPIIKGVPEFKGSW